MSQRAAGTFVVTSEAEPPFDSAEGATLGRMKIDKQFQGDLEASSVVHMLSAMSGTQGSAGYVALERVQGRLHGKSGSFVLQHSGTMNRGRGSLAVSVVPDTGTAQLRGLSGTMTIEIVEGKHLYTFDYAL